MTLNFHFSFVLGLNFSTLFFSFYNSNPKFVSVFKISQKCCWIDNMCRIMKGSQCYQIVRSSKSAVKNRQFWCKKHWTLLHSPKHRVSVNSRVQHCTDMSVQPLPGGNFPRNYHCQGIAVQYSTVHLNTLQYTVQYNAVQYSTVQFNIQSPDCHCQGQDPLEIQPGATCLSQWQALVRTLYTQFVDQGIKKFC